MKKSFLQIINFFCKSSKSIISHIFFITWSIICGQSKKYINQNNIFFFHETGELVAKMSNNTRLIQYPANKEFITWLSDNGFINPKTRMLNPGQHMSVLKSVYEQQTLSTKHQEISIAQQKEQYAAQEQQQSVVQVQEQFVPQKQQSMVQRQEKFDTQQSKQFVVIPTKKNHEGNKKKFINFENRYYFSLFFNITFLSGFFFGLIMSLIALIVDFFLKIWTVSPVTCIKIL